MRRTRQQHNRQSETFPTQGSSSSSSSERETGSHGSQDAVLVGRGFFGWILEEEGDGDTVVVGRISSEGIEERRRKRADSWEGGSFDDEDFDDDRVEEYLDVEIRMKETEAQSREQYFTMLRQFGSGPRSASSSSQYNNHSNAAKRIPPSQVTAASSMAAVNHRPRSVVSKSSPVKSASRTLPTAPQSTNQLQTMQVLQLLQALKAQQQAHGGATVGESALNPTAVEALFRIAGFSNAGAQSVQPAIPTFQRSASAPKPSTSTSTRQESENRSAQNSALEEVFRAAGLPLPAGIMGEAAKPSAEEVKTPSSRSVSAAEKPESSLQCYNCGMCGDTKLTWRLVVPRDGQRVEHPASFECDPQGSQDDDLQDLTPDSEGFVTANGRSSWRACNRCGLFWTKWKKNRPEVLERGKSAGLSAAKKRGKSGDRSANGTPAGDDEDEMEDECDEIDDSSPPSKGSDGLRRPPKRVRRSNPMELVKDKHGQWRSKRSVQENPEGRKPGRPPGCKTGEGQGKSRYARRKARLAQLSAEPTDGDGPSAATETIDTTTKSSSASRPAPPAHAQSSPVRGSSTASGRHFPWAAASKPAGNAGASHLRKMPNLTPEGLTPNRRAVRYGAPSHLLTSSPSTALDALLSEGDFSFDFDPPSLSAPGVTQSSPVRRSPRKHPHGTRDHHNPYATNAVVAGNGSPRTKSSATDASGLFDLDFFAAFTNLRSPASISPVSKKPSPSSQVSQDEQQSNAAATDITSLWTEAEGSRRQVRRTGDEVSSSALTSMTSPGSPSPAASKRYDVRAHHPSALTSRNTNILLASSSPSGRSKAEDDDQEQDEEDDDQSDSPSRARKQRLSSRRSASLCPGSPSLGQKRKRDVAASASVRSGTIQASSVEASETVLTKGPSPSPASRSAVSRLATPTRGAGGDDGDVFGLPVRRTTSRAPSLSPAVSLKGLPILSPRTIVAGQGNSLKVPTPRRRPLPATVEDAPSSSAGSSPIEEGVSPYDHGTVESMLDMLEDPYGLLEANGIGLAGLNRVSGDGSTGAFSMEQFEDIQLHDKLQFGSHYRTFTEEGSKGVAALAVPGLTASGSQASGKDVDGTALETSPTKLSIAGTPANDQQSHSVAPATPEKEQGDPMASASTPRSSLKAAPLTPSRATRSSPRFSKHAGTPKQRQHLDSLAMPPPPTTPRRKAEQSRNTAKGQSAVGSGTLPRTPTAKTKLSPTSLALANAVVRSPALQRMLKESNASVEGGLTGRVGSPGSLDFSALFGSLNGGALSPLFATPAAPNNSGNTAPMMTPLSPSLCRLLNSFGEEQGQANSTNEATAAEDNAKALVPAVGTHFDSTAFPSEAFAELSQLLQDPSFESLLGTTEQRSAAS